MAQHPASPHARKVPDYKSWPGAHFAEHVVSDDAASQGKSRQRFHLTSQHKNPGSRSGRRWEGRVYLQQLISARRRRRRRAPPRRRVAAPREHSPTRRRGRSNNNKLISTKKKQKRKKIKDRYDWKAQQERPKAHFSPTYKAKAWGPLQPNRLDWRGPDEWPRLRRCRAWSAPFDPSSDGQDHSRGNPRRDREAGAAASISRRRRIPRRLLLLPLGFRLASPAARLASSTVRSPRFATAIVLARLLLVANLVFAEFFDTYVKFCGFLMTCRSEIIEIDWVELGGG